MSSWFFPETVDEASNRTSSTYSEEDDHPEEQESWQDEDAALDSASPPPPPPSAFAQFHAAGESAGGKDLSLQDRIRLERALESEEEDSSMSHNDTYEDEYVLDDQDKKERSNAFDASQDDIFEDEPASTNTSVRSPSGLAFWLDYHENEAVDPKPQEHEQGESPLLSAWSMSQQEERVFALESLPDDENVSVTTMQEDPRRRRCWVILFYAISCLCLIIIAIVLTVLLVHKNNNNKSQEQENLEQGVSFVTPTDQPSLGVAPTMDPTLAPSQGKTTMAPVAILNPVTEDSDSSYSDGPAFPTKFLLAASSDGYIQVGSGVFLRGGDIVTVQHTSTLLVRAKSPSTGGVGSLAFFTFDTSPLPSSWWKDESQRQSIQATFKFHVAPNPTRDAAGTSVLYTKLYPNSNGDTLSSDVEDYRQREQGATNTTLEDQGWIPLLNSGKGDRRTSHQEEDFSGVIQLDLSPYFQNDFFVDEDEGSTNSTTSTTMTRREVQILLAMESLPEEDEKQEEEDTYGIAENADFIQIFSSEYAFVNRRPQLQVESIAEANGALPGQNKACPICDGDKGVVQPDALMTLPWDGDSLGNVFTDSLAVETCETVDQRGRDGMYSDETCASLKIIAQKASCCEVLELPAPFVCQLCPKINSKPEGGNNRLIEPNTSTKTSGIVNPDAVVSVPFATNRTCQEYQTASENHQLSQPFCSVLTTYTSAVCCSVVV